MGCEHGRTRRLCCSPGASEAMSDGRKENRTAAHVLLKPLEDRPQTAVYRVWRRHVGDSRGPCSAPAVERTSRVHIAQGPNQPPKHSETPRRVYGEFQRTCEAHAQGHLGAPPVKPPPLLRTQAMTSAPRRAARWVGLCFSPSCSPSAHLK